MRVAEGLVLGADEPISDDPLIDDHECSCGWCRESLVIPDDDRRSEQHASMRFGDNARHPRVLVDGTAVEGRCFEAIGGDDGRAWCFRMNDWGRPWHQCKTCGKGACMEQLRGNVEVIWSS